MDKKKTYKERKKHSLKKPTIVKSRKVRDSLNFLNDMKNHGLEKIYLSPLTQKVLECCIGDNITPENRWVFIKKEKIEDNIFLHDTSSEFLPIKSKIEKYPETEMLIGSYSHIQDAKTDFFLCTTVDIKNHVLFVIESEKKNIYERMWNLIHPYCRTWVDLGSEIEVDDTLPKKFRPLFEIVLSSEYPIQYHGTKFTMTHPQDSRSSYIETLGGRFPYDLIHRRRVDASTQSHLPSENKSIQSKLSVLRNKHVQYSYRCKTFEMTEKASDDIKMFFLNKCDILYETLLVNFNINLFCDDYKELAKNDKGISFKDPLELRSYQDVINCKHKKVSCISWNALVSGMVAVAYSITPLYYIGKHARLHNDAEDTVYERHLILLWMYKDNVRPKLYIHAYREVTALNFCPYDENILVGGYSNGQIAVWDIKHRIRAVETREVLTHLEQHHRSIMIRQTAWIKPAFGSEHVFPTITSHFSTSHTSAVTSIVWMPSTHYITNMGIYEQTKPDQGHMQFFTTALSGGTVQVWDLIPQKKQMEKKTWKKRTQRLSKLPAALTQTESPLKKLQKMFAPHYRIFIKNPLTGMKNPLTNIVAKNQMYAYEALNPKTVEKIEERTYFRVIGPMSPVDNTQQLILSSALGTLALVKWDGSAYNQGLNINSEPCSIHHFANVHDGPITACEINPLLPEMLLTTGGSVFAIWYCESLNVPLMWRKGNVRYIRGMWSFRHPLTLFMTRCDSHFEIWNMLEKSEDPVRCFKYKGNQLISLFNDPNRLHSRKDTFITADIVGAIKVFNLPAGIITLSDNSKEESKAYIEHAVAIKKNTEELKIKIKKELETAAASKEQNEETEEMQQVTHRPEQKSIKLASPIYLEKVVQKSNNKWQKRLEIHMYNILMEKKNLNLEEIEKNRKPMQEIMDQETRKQQKINHKIMIRDEEFEKFKDTLLLPVESHKIRRKITINLPKEVTKVLKQNYFENFKKIEAETLQGIQEQRFKFNLNWNHMMQFGMSAIRK